MSNLIQLVADDMRGERPSIEPIPGTRIAGGAVRRWFTGEETLSDIDVFCNDAAAEKEFIETLEGFEKVGDHKNATTFSRGRTAVQVIKIFHPTTEATLNSFDFTICQFAWDENGIWATQKAIIQTLRKHLAINKITSGYEMDSLRRAFKYQRKGFSPCLGTLRDLANSLLVLTPETIQQQIEISPGGGKRVIRYD